MFVIFRYLISIAGVLDFTSRLW